MFKTGFNKVAGSLSKSRFNRVMPKTIHLGGSTQKETARVLQAEQLRKKIKAKDSSRGISTGLSFQSPMRGTLKGAK